MIAALGFDWLHTEWAAALLAAPLLLGAGLFGLHARARGLAALGAGRAARRAAAGHSAARAALRLACAVSALLLGALALLGPARGFSLREIRQKGVDLVLCLDTSRSMLARDLRPDRLTRAKREIAGLIDRLRGDRLALIAFAGDAREVAPLTRDKHALLDLIERITPDDNRQGGTDLAVAIERALALFDGRSGAHEAIVLLTDGEDLEGKGLAAAKQALEKGIRVYVVGIGTLAGGKIPVLRNDGREGFLKDAEGKEVVSALGVETLVKLAQEAGGDYLSTEQSPTPLEELYERRISRLERHTLEEGLLRIPHDRFQWFLVLALCFVLVELALSEQRSARANAVPRVARARAGLRAASVLALLGLCARGALAQSGALAPAPQAAPPAAAPSAAAAPQSRPATPAYAGTSAEGLREIAQLLERGEPAAALPIAKSLLERAGTPALDEGSEAELLYSMGLALDALGEHEAAAQAFSSASVYAGPGALRLDAAYNAGAVELERAEALFAKIQQAAKGAASAAQAPAAPGAPAPDPKAALAEAKQAYLAARERLLERARLAAGHADTRANLELALRRIREIEKLEQQQEQPPQSQPNQDQQQPQSQPSKQDAQQPPQSQPDKSDAQQDPKQGQDSKQPPDQKPSDAGQQKPEDAQPKDGQKDPQGQQSGGEPKPPEDAQQDEQKGEGQPGEQAPEGPEDPKQARKLTREELKQLLDKLEELDKKTRELRAQLRRNSRRPVEKDW